MDMESGTRRVERKGQGIGTESVGKVRRPRGIIRVRRAGSGPQSLLAIRGLAAVLALGSGGVPAQDVEREMLRAEFDDKPVDQPIGTGGATVGEPFAVDPSIDAMVRSGVGADRELEISSTGELPSAASVQFGLLGDAGVAHGVVQFDLTVTMPTYSYVYLAMREPRWASYDFLTMHFLDSGDLIAYDAAGSIPLAPYAYAPGVPQHMRLTYDMDARTYDVAINDTPLVIARAHGIVEAGVGQLSLSVPHHSAPQLFMVDDISATWTFDDPVFANGFDSDPGASP